MVLLLSTVKVRRESLEVDVYFIFDTIFHDPDELKSNNDDSARYQLARSRLQVIFDSISYRDGCCYRLTFEKDVLSWRKCWFRNWSLYGPCLHCFCECFSSFPTVCLSYTVRCIRLICVTVVEELLLTSDGVKPEAGFTVESGCRLYTALNAISFILECSFLLYT